MSPEKHIWANELHAWAEDRWCIEVKHKGYGWGPTLYPDFNHPTDAFRIKPQPKQPDIA